MEMTLVEKTSELNRPNHEASKILECKPEIKAYNGRWIKKSEIDKLEKIGQPVYMDEENVLLYPMSHDMIIGSTGKGKTTVIYDNKIDFYSSLPESIRPNMFISDVKGDSYEKLSQMLRQRGYEVYRFNGNEPYYSLRYNPLTKIYRDYHRSLKIKKMIDEGKIKNEYNGVRYATKQEAIDMAYVDYSLTRDSVDRAIAELSEIMIVNTDAKNLSWTMGGRGCLRAIITAMLKDSEKPYLGLTEDKFTIANLTRIACDAADDYEEIKDWLGKYEEEELVIENALSSVYRLKATVTRDGYLSSMTAELAKFSNLSIEAITSNSDIDVDKLVNGDKSFALFFVPNDRVSIIDNVGIMFLNQVLNTLCDKADKTKEKRLKRDFVALVDEFANFPKIPDMTKKISTYRSRKIWLELSIQSIEQLYTKYGKEETGAIIDNCNNTYFLGCNSFDTRQSYSQQFGFKQGCEYTTSIGTNGTPNVSTRNIDVPVLRKSDLERVELGSFFLKSSDGDNLKSSMIPYFRRKDITIPELDERDCYNGYRSGSSVYSLSIAGKGEQAEQERIREEEMKRNPQPVREEPKKEEKPQGGGFSFFNYNEKIKRTRPNYTVSNEDRRRLIDLLWNQVREGAQKEKNGQKKLDKLCKQGIFTRDINEEIQKRNNLKSYISRPYPFGPSREDSLVDLKNVLEFNMEFGQEKGKGAYLRRLNRSFKCLKASGLFSNDVQEVFEKLIKEYKKMTKTEFAKRYDYIRGVLMFA